MALFVLHKLILQMRMHSHPVGLDVWFFVGPFVYFHTSCVRTAKALARPCRCAPEPSLVAYVISTIISWAGSNDLKVNLLQFLLLVADMYVGSWFQDCLGYPSPQVINCLCGWQWVPRKHNIMITAYWDRPSFANGVNPDQSALFAIPSASCLRLFSG